MAAGLRDILALQGVTPVSAAPVPDATPGLRIGQLDGTWITGAPAGAPANAGLRPGQLDGTWITGAPPVVVVPGDPGLYLLQLQGVWITGSPEFEIVVEVEADGGGGSRKKIERQLAEQGLSRLEMEEIFMIVQAVLRVLG